MNFRSPYGCVHQVLVMENGQGKIIIGTEANQSREIDFNQIIRQESFKINTKDLVNLRDLAASISTPLIKGPISDGFRSTLLINGSKEIDFYGDIPEVIKAMSSILSQYYSFEVDYFCEGYIGQAN
ncbi:hypothetical protein ACYSNM_12710 [Myroides sp. LJL116]